MEAGAPLQTPLDLRSRLVCDREQTFQLVSDSLLFSRRGEGQCKVFETRQTHFLLSNAFSHRLDLRLHDAGAHCVYKEANARQINMKA